MRSHAAGLHGPPRAGRQHEVGAARGDRLDQRRRPLARIRSVAVKEQDDVGPARDACATPAAQAWP